MTSAEGAALDPESQLRNNGPAGLDFISRLSSYHGLYGRGY
jgi:hypothetical protein